MSDYKEVTQLIAKAAETKDSGDAIRFSQAACNAANAMRVMAELMVYKGSNPMHFKEAQP